MTKKVKRSRSAELTGGGGFTYEDSVVAYYLAALLREEAAMGGNGVVVKVAVQQAAQGEPMDDLVVDTKWQNEPARLSLQVKSSLTISDSDTDFKAVISESLATRSKPDFRVGKDQYGFIADSVATGRLDALNRFIRRARASTTASEFVSRFGSAGESSKTDIALRDELRGLINPANDEAEWDFYRHFVAYRMDGLEPGGDRLVELGNRLAPLSENGGPQFVELLCRQVRLGEGVAKVWTRGSLLADLRSAGVRLKIAPSFAHDLSILTTYSTDALADIRTDIAGCNLERLSFVTAAEVAASKYVFSNISGLPGCGKSVILRRCVERALEKGPVLLLKSDRLEGTNWQSFARKLGLQHASAAELLVEIGSAGTPVLFIDGIDRIKPEQRGIVSDLFHTIERDKELRHWRALVTSRDQGLEVLRSWIPASLYSKTGLGDVSVGPLDDDEAEALAEQHPALRPLLFGAAAAREIARRPFFAAVLADQTNAMGFDKNPPPQTESELINAWWKAGGYNVEPEAADARQRALLDLAEVGAPSLGKAIRGRRIKAETATQLESLRRDKIIDVLEAGSSYKFSHDIFFEWAFFRLLIDHGSDWPAALVVAGEPPLLARIVSLLSQHTFERGGDWPGGYALLNGRPLRPQWRRAWLLGPPASTRFTDHLAVFEGLLAQDDCLLLEKFLVWFQAERTIPSPLILQSPVEGFDSATIVRAADLLGWPSDMNAWKRVLTWLFASLDRLPATMLPHVVELFNVWQNMFAGLPNPYSKRIVEAAESWTVELEGETTEGWRSLKADSRDALAGSLRQIILRAARAYPDSAIRTLDRLIAWESRSEELLNSVFGLAPVLSQICPEKLAEIVKIDVLEELPKEQLEREKREREQRYARRKALREKPESELTPNEQRMLSSIFEPIGHTTYDFDDLGIGHLHGSFYPPAPGHEPFASLFQFAPDVARSLVRDLANHATIGWCQIHEINHPHHGTPVPIEITFPWGTQQFWGNDRSYAWFFGEGGPQPLESAFLAMTYWAHQQLDTGTDLDDLIRKVVEGHESVAALGLAVSLALERNERAPSLLALMKSQRLWVLDFHRQVQEGGREINLFGFDVRSQMSAKQKAADQYLKRRTYRQRSLKDLAYLYALSADESERAEFAAALARFPSELPYAVEEQRGHAETEASMRETAEAWAQFANRENYALRQVPERSDLVQLTYNDPTPQSEATVERRIEAEKSLREFSIVSWAAQSIQNGALDPRMTLEAALTFAQERDAPDLLLQVADLGSGMRQSCVVAVAALAIRFGAEANDLKWAWSVINRAADIKEEGPFRYSNNSLDPRFFCMVALKADISSGSPCASSGVRLLSKASDPNPHIAQGAFAALFDTSSMPPALTWNAAVLASELFSNHVSVRPYEADESAQATHHREQALTRAIARLGASPYAEELVAPPAAWLLESGTPRRRGRRVANEETWTYPSFDFNPQFAAEIIKSFPIEKWGERDELRPKLVEYVTELVRWTADRIFPPFAEEERERGSQLYKWLLALASLVARVIVFCPPEEAAKRFIKPLSKHRHRDVLHYLGDLTERITCRHIYDAPAVPPVALAILDSLMTRMLAEPEFSPTSYRPGEIRDRHLVSMLESFLMISVKDAPGAARYANGEWRDLPLVMPLINRLMQAAGWSDVVMDKFMTLGQRAGAHLPIEMLSQWVVASMDAEGFRLERWNDAGIPASISGVIQKLADANYPLTKTQARDLLLILDRLVDIGDRRAAALQQSEHFRSIQIAAGE
ncbi:hypothetical protein ACN28I_30795 [Archangium gephyra]|uniref:hypothetical protein n=1 Tax=Archangium gephyra TaxID=48 RepID=UPI003B7D2E56